MLIKKWGAPVLSGLVFCAWSVGAAAAPDGLLGQFRTLFAEKGSAAVAELAAGLGVRTRTEQNRLLVPVILDRSVARAANFSRRIAPAGARVDAHSRSWTRLLVPVSRLDALFRAFPDDSLHAPIPAHPSFGLGGRISESLALTGADGYQAGGLDGTGVRVAVVDLGFTGLANAISAGELPADTVGVDFTGTGLEGSGITKHGVGVAEHVSDMAPGVRIYCLRVQDQVDLENAATYIRDNNIPIANHSVSWVLASYYDGTGPVSDIVNQSHDNDGVFWTVASGNHARQHWRGGWADSDGDNILEFSGSDELMALSGGASTASLYLNWNQYGINNKTDLNLYVVDNAGTLVAASTIQQSSPFNNAPAEAVAFTYQASQAPYSAFVFLNSGSTAGLDITLFSFSHNFEHAVAASSMMDPASAHGAFAVGAVNQASWNNANPPIRGYSSRGPTTDGRLAPDLVAPDGTSSLAYGITASNGTSFSSPTTAGAAALLLDQNGARTALDLASLLRSGAIDVGAAGADNVYGYGKLQLPLIDSDSDQLTNVEEIALGTDALDSDSDDDGLDDYQESQIYLTDPLDPDSDSDGVNDFDEAVVYGTDPLISNVGDLAPHGSPDGAINQGDYLVLLRMVLHEITPNPAELVFGDLNGNTGLDSGDLILLRQLIDAQPSP